VAGVREMYNGREGGPDLNLVNQTEVQKKLKKRLWEVVQGTTAGQIGRERNLGKGENKKQKMKKTIACERPMNHHGSEGRVHAVEETSCERDAKTRRVKKGRGGKRRHGSAESDCKKHLDPEMRHGDWKKPYNRREKE